MRFFQQTDQYINKYSGKGLKKTKRQYAGGIGKRPKVIVAL